MTRALHTKRQVALQEARLRELNALDRPLTSTESAERDQLDYNRDQRRRRALQQLPRAQAWVEELQRRVGMA